MEYILEREKTGSTPYVLIDESKGYIKFEGESYSENIIDFFDEISKWLTGYLESDFERLVFDCELKYFNSSTAKLLLNMIMEMDEAAEGRQVIINWITTEDDEINIECGEDFKEDMENLTFNIVIKEEELL